MFYMFPCWGEEIFRYTKDLKLERTSLYGGSTLVPHGKKYY